MHRIIGGDGRENGPFSAEQLWQWVTGGRGNAQTRDRPEGVAAWQALGSVLLLIPVMYPGCWPVASACL
jgi:hypothetical protein